MRTVSISESRPSFGGSAGALDSGTSSKAAASALASATSSAGNTREALREPHIERAPPAASDESRGGKLGVSQLGSPLDSQ